MVTIDEIAWYPLRITYSQEMKVKEYLDKEHIESFIPMRYVEKECQGKKTRQLVPAIVRSASAGGDKGRLYKPVEQKGYRKLELPVHRFHSIPKPVRYCRTNLPRPLRLCRHSQ